MKSGEKKRKLVKEKEKKKKKSESEKRCLSLSLFSSAQSPSDLAGGHTHTQTLFLDRTHLCSSSCLTVQFRQFAFRQCTQASISHQWSYWSWSHDFRTRPAQAAQAAASLAPCTLNRAAICPRVVGPLLLSGPKPLLLPHCCCCDKCRFCQTVGACLFVPLPLFSPSSLLFLFQCTEVPEGQVHTTLSHQSVESSV